MISGQDNVFKGPTASAMRQAPSVTRRESSSMRSAKRSLRWWLRNPCAGSDAQILSVTCVLALITYLSLGMLLGSGVDQGMVDDENSYAVLPEPQGPDVAPLEWVGKSVEVYWPRNDEW